MRRRRCLLLIPPVQVGVGGGALHSLFGKVRVDGKAVIYGNKHVNLIYRHVFIYYFASYNR